MTSQLYSNAAGLTEVGELLRPDDVVYAGEIPMAALHESDRLRMLAYPASLARRIRRGSQTARLNIVYVVPDWGTDEAAFEPGRPYNLTPAGKIYGRQPDLESSDESRAHFWEALFELHAEELRENARAADVKITRASDLVEQPGFRSVLRLALNAPTQIAEAIRESGAATAEIEEKPLVFGGGACRACGSIAGTTDYDSDWDRAQFVCDDCDSSQEADIQEQPMWLQEDVLRAAIIAGLQPDVVIRRPGMKWDARERLIDSLLMLAGGENTHLPTRLAPPSLDSEQGGTPLKDLLRLAEDWTEPYAELP